MEGVKFPEVTVKLSETNGNVFSILGKVKKAMERAGCSREDVKAFLDEATSGDYDHAIQTAVSTVNVE